MSDRNDSTSAKRFAVSTFAAFVCASSFTPARAYAPIPDANAFVVEGTADPSSASMRTSATVDLTYTQIAQQRLLELSKLQEDHDGEGASAPEQDSIDLAAKFIEDLPYYAPDYVVGLSRQGLAVIEFREDDIFGQVIFGADRTIEAYYRVGASPMELIEGAIDDPETLSSFRKTFEFTLFA